MSDDEIKETVYDFSGSEFWEDLRKAVPELTEEEYPIFTCIGGGRSFSVDMEWDVLYDEELWEKIKEAETNSSI